MWSKIIGGLLQAIVAVLGTFGGMLVIAWNEDWPCCLEWVVGIAMYFAAAYICIKIREYYYGY